ncbi:MAG: mannose-6-phosphate isomerase, class I [Actinomycetota bacterium]
MDLLDGVIQPYAWGDPQAIADLQGRTPSGEPEAELWLGAHPVAPGRLASTGRSLADATAAEPAAVLGAAVADRFGRFPYLLKILAAAEPLSIQVHPSLIQAKAGFAREEEHGPALGQPDRTYRDDNHKPELICALTPFEAKCGFRDPELTTALVGALAARRGGTQLSSFAAALSVGGTAGERLSATLAWLFGLSADDAATLVDELLDAAAVALAEIADGAGADVGAHRDELESLAELHRFHPGDVGIPVSLLLNHVTLAPGQAMFLPAGNMHAYLRGVGVELMANSDNVIRGGLTVKHIDVDELLAVVDTNPMTAPVQTAVDGVHRFDTPVPEFALERVTGTEIEAVPTGPEIVLVTAGEARLRPADGADREAELLVGRGAAAIVYAADGPYRLTAPAGTVAWRATVGDLSLSA